MDSGMALEILKLPEDGSAITVKIKQEAAAYLLEIFVEAKETKAARKAASKEIKEAKTPVKANTKTKTKAKAKGDSND